MRKGQAALEFLMTYGWAILVVLAAIAALAYFGVLSPDKFFPNKCTASGGFSCSEYKVDGTTSEIQVSVQNNLGVDADEVNVTITSDDCALGPSGGAQAGAAPTYSFNAPLANGKKTGLQNFTCTSGTFPASKFNGDLDIIYVRAGETVTHKASGSITSAVE